MLRRANRVLVLHSCFQVAIKLAYSIYSANNVLFFNTQNFKRMGEEKRILVTDNSFLAAGNKYIIHSSLNIERYRVLEELQVRARFGQNYAQLHNGFLKVVDLVNKGKRFEADIAMHNMMQGTVRAMNKQHDPVLLMATLFCCEETEDRTIWSEESANEKIEIWSQEGYPVEDFFRLSLQLCRRYQDGLFSDLVDTLEEEEAM